MATGFRVRVFENVANLPVQVSARLRNVARVLDVFWVPCVSEETLVDDLGKTDDGVKWCPKLMAHMRDEFRLGTLAFDGSAFGFGESHEQAPFHRACLPERTDCAGGSRAALELTYEERCEAGSRECGAQDHEEVEGQRSAPGSKSRFCVHKGGCDNRPAPATRRKHAAIGSGSDEECAALVVAQEGSAKDALRDERSGVVLHGDDF